MAKKINAVMFNFDISNNYNTTYCDYECVAPEGYWDYDNEENICKYCWFKTLSETDELGIKHNYDLGLIAFSSKDKQYDEEILTIYYKFKSKTN